jgi:hypothetical protein
MFSNSCSGHAAVLLELRNSSEVSSHSRFFLHVLGTDHAQKTQPLYFFMAQTIEKTRVTCETASSLVRYQHWAWRERHRIHNVFYCCMLERVYRAVARQRVDQIRYSIIKRNTALPHPVTYWISGHKSGRLRCCK